MYGALCSGCACRVYTVYHEQSCIQKLFIFGVHLCEPLLSLVTEKSQKFFELPVHGPQYAARCHSS